MARRTGGQNYTRQQHGFAKTPSVGGERSVFNRSTNLKTAFDAGTLVPIFCDEALPGDTLNMKMSSFCRLATPIFPVMDNIYMDFFFFAVPNRLLWDNWQKFCGEQDDPGDSVTFVVPTIDTTVAAGSLYDYMGLPVHAGVVFNAFHPRAYNLIFKEWFRDQNLTDSPAINTGDGPDSASDYVLRRRAKRHDYFTSCLPFPMKGPELALPIGDAAPVIGVSDKRPTFTGDNWANQGLNITGATGVQDTKWSQNAGSDPAEWALTRLEADLGAATGATIATLREAFQVQRIFERDARAGTRYTEILKSHFHVDSGDARLNRPEYLGGGSTRVNITPVSATGGDSGQPDVGVLAAFGTQSARNIGFVKSFVEHCVVIGLVNVRAEITYQEGLERMWSRQTRFDYYWPTLAHLGEQEVLNKELVFEDNAADVDVFGYQERWAEYRYKPSMTTNIMRSSHAQSLDVWHLALDFAGQVPALNNAFIEDNPPISRIVAAPTEPDFIGDFYFKYKCARPMPTYSVPGMIDHF